MFLCLSGGSLHKGVAVMVFQSTDVHVALQHPGVIKFSVFCLCLMCSGIVVVGCVIFNISVHKN